MTENDFSRPFSMYSLRNAVENDDAFFNTNESNAPRALSSPYSSISMSRQSLDKKRILKQVTFDECVIDDQDFTSTKKLIKIPVKAPDCH